MCSFFKIISKYFFIISYLFVIGINSYILSRYDYSFSSNLSVSKVVFSCFSTIILYLAVLLFVSKVKYKILLFLLSILLTICISLDFVFFVLFQSRLAIGNLVAAFDTNHREAAGFFAMVGYKGIIIFLIEFIIITLALFQASKRVNEWKKKTLLGFITICVLISGLSCWLTPGVITIDAKIIPYSIKYFKEKQKVKSYYKANRAVPSWIKKNENADIPEKLFFVIGESSARKHYSLYGYNIPTTPFLDRLYSKDSLIRVDNVISPGHVTTSSLQISLTNSSPRNLSPFYKEKNIVEMAKERGYETLWISNDGELDSWQDNDGVYLNTIIHQIAHTSDKVEFMTKDDFDLLPFVKKYYKPGKRQVFFIHLIGSHQDYNERYDNEDISALMAYPRLPSTAYDRSIHHTDRLLAQLYNIAKVDENSMIVYFSDHAEIVNVGHGLTNRGIEQFEIPLVVIPFKYNKTSIESIINRYRGQNDILNTTNLSQIFYELIGYSIPDNIVNKNKEDGKYLYEADEKVYSISNISQNIFVPEK